VRITFLESGSLAPVAGHRFHLVPPFHRGGALETYETDANGVAELRIASGEYVILCWGPDEGPDARSEVRTEPIATEVPSLPDRVFEQTVLVQRPEATLRVLVVDEANEPVEDASVYIEFRAKGVVESSFERTNGKGLAFLGIWESRDFTDGLLRAWDAEGNVSSYVPVEAPFVPGLRSRPGAGRDLVDLWRPEGGVRNGGVGSRGSRPVELWPALSVTL